MKEGKFSVACEVEKKRVKEENGFEKMTLENESNVIEHSKKQELESKKICHKFLAYRGIGSKGVGE